MTWREKAACIGLDTEMFYAHEGHPNPRKRSASASHALAVCRACDVRPQCLDAALTEPGPQHGIRGGTYAKDRTRMVLRGKAS